MINVSIEADIKQAAAKLTTVQRRIVPRATNSAINKTVRNVATALNRHISKETGLKIGDIKKGMNIRRSTFTTLSAVITGRGRAVTLRRFVSPGKRVPGAFRKQRGVTANPWRKRRLFPDTFIIWGRNHGQALVAVRKGTARRPIHILKGPSIRQEMNRPASRRLMSATARDRFRVNFERELTYQLSRMRQ